MGKYLVIFAVVFGMNAFAQTEKQLEKVSEATCDCLKDKDIETGDMNRLQMELGVCLLDAMAKNKVPMDTGDMGQMEELGRKVGMKLAFTCPKFLEIMGEMAEEDPDGFESLIEDSQEIQLEAVDGSVLGVESGDFVTLKLKTNSGRKETLYWMEYFEGSNLLENGGSAIKGKEVYIEFEVMEVYSPKIEDYTNLKIIRFLAIEE